MTFNPKHRSHIITKGRDRAPARAMLKAIGFTDDDLQKPIVGVAHMWVETMPCNFNHRDLAVKVKEGIRAAGATPMEFNTISISDGVTMGTEPIAAIREGDMIVFDLAARRLDLEVPEEEIKRRLDEWKPPTPRYISGVFSKYAALVSSASEGAITRV